MTDALDDNDMDFSDRVQGEDIELLSSPSAYLRRAGNSASSSSSSSASAPESSISNSLPGESAPFLLRHMSATQLVTLSGAASGLVAGVVVCPLDVVKTRLQAQGHQKHPKTIVSEFTNIFKNEGVRGLYRGLVPITIGYLPTWTIYFTIYERAKKFYPKFMKSNFNWQYDSMNHFLAALTAGLASSIAVNPIWVVKTRLMLQNNVNKALVKGSQYKGTIDAFKTMYREEGVRVFYSGLIPSLFGLLHVGIHFPVYEKLKEITGCNTHHVQLRGKQAHESDEIDFKLGPNHLLWRLIFASSLAKMIASTITYPHEILRTRMQLRSSKEFYGTVHSNGDDKGKLMKTLVSIYKKEGLRGYYAGYVVNLARTVPASAVTLVSFEYFKNYLLDITGKSLA